MDNNMDAASVELGLPTFSDSLISFNSANNLLRSAYVTKLNHYVLGPKGSNNFLALANPRGKFVKATSLGGYVDTTSIETLLHGDSWLVTHMDRERMPEPHLLELFEQSQVEGESL